MSGNNQIMVSASGSSGIGICCQDTDDGYEAPIAGPGNIVYAGFNTAIAVGSAVYGSGNGLLGTYLSGKKAVGYVVHSGNKETTNYVGKVLLV